MSAIRRGVLRTKKKPEEDPGKFEDLLVFGYACKLFRDDDKALYIDQGKHLIPWMGDEDLKIDRYDARGALYDLKPYEPKSGQFSRFDGLSAEEKRVEELCDQERYFALYKDEREEALYHEEEMKRLQLEINEATSSEATYHQVPFSYSGPPDDEAGERQTTESTQKSIKGEIGDAVFVPPPEMDIPLDILVPPTLKLALIIQKTAQFIATQGTQMEIVLKAKQANNPMFEFLNFDSALQPYYKFVTTAIRKGTYVMIEEPAEESKPSQNDEEEHTDEESDDESYLHPSLQPKTVVPPAVVETELTEAVPFVHPPPDVQPLIDKTASYVARNGRNIEAVVLSKGDPRFVFLQGEHAYHPYYLHKLNLYSGMIGTKEAEKPEKLSPEEVEERLKTERRLKAAAFLDQIKKKIALKTAAATSSASPSEQEALREAEEITSLVTRSRSRTVSSDDVEVIGSIAKKRLRRSRSRSRSPERRRRHRRSPSHTRSRSRSRSRSRDCSRSRERRRRHRKQRDRSKDRSRREKRRHKSKDRHQKRKNRHRRRSPSPSVSRSRSRSTTASRLQSNSSSPVRKEPTTTIVSKPASIPSSEVSRDSPLPPQLQPIQPALAKIAEGLRAKVLALFDEGPK